MSHFYNKFSNPNIKVKAGKLFLRSFSLEKLAEKFGTSLYVVDAERIEERYMRFIKPFQSTSQSSMLLILTRQIIVYL
jgi:diaminopimelate decarboxylase